MKAVILAAGSGERLKEITREKHKCLIEIGDKSLLEHSLSILADNGIGEVVIVVGYLRESIKEKIGKNYNGMKIKYVDNDETSKGNLYSLYLTKDKVNDDFVFLDADIIYHPEILKTLLRNESRNAILVAEMENDTGEEVKVYGERDRATGIGKKRREEKLIGEAVGIVKYSKEAKERIFEEIERMLEENPSYEHEDLNQKLCDIGLMSYVKAEKLPWTEIDFIEDVKKAKKVYDQIREG